LAGVKNEFLNANRRASAIRRIGHTRWQAHIAVAWAMRLKRSDYNILAKKIYIISALVSEPYGMGAYKTN